MPFSPLNPNLQMATWSQLVEIAPGLPAKDRPRFHAIADWYTGVAQGYLDEVGTREELAAGYGVSARQLRRWIGAFNEGGIPRLLQRWHGRGGRKRKVKAVDFTEQFLAVAEQSVPKRNGWVSGKALYDWCRTNVGLDVSYGTFLRYVGGRLKSYRKPVPTLTPEEYLAGVATGRWPTRLKDFGVRYRQAQRRAQKKMLDRAVQQPDMNSETFR